MYIPSSCDFLYFIPNLLKVRTTKESTADILADTYKQTTTPSHTLDVTQFPFCYIHQTYMD